MKTKHTPGPWKLNHSNFTIEKEGRFASWIEIKKNGKTLAEAKGFHHGIQNVKCKANAKLIAAAPELLEACVIALIHLETDEIEKGVQHMLKLAIQKATQ